MRSRHTYLLLAACLFSLPGSSQKLIIYSGKENLFPSSWLEKPVKAKATVPDEADVQADTMSVVTALGYYPGNLLEQHLRNIYITGTLRCFGVPYLGTNSRQDIYIALHANDEVERTFHHEFSSILLRNFPAHFDKAAWLQLSPELLNTSSAKAIRQGLSGTAADSALLEKGYLSPYSLSNYENDFNMYAEYLFTATMEFWQMAEKHTRVMQKIMLVIGFYQKVNPLYNIAFFRAVAEQRGKAEKGM